MGFQVKNEFDYEDSVSEDSEQSLSTSQKKPDTLSLMVMDLRSPVEETIPEPKKPKKLSILPKLPDKRLSKRSTIEQRAREVKLI